MAVPKKGARRKDIVAAALCLGGKRSAFVPAPTLSTVEPASPAKKRQTIKDANDLLKPPPRVKSMLVGKLTRYTICLPQVSLAGAAITGPNAKPSTHSVTPRYETTVETPKFFAISCTAGEYAEDPNVLHPLSAIVCRRDHKYQCKLTPQNQIEQV